MKPRCLLSSALLAGALFAMSVATPTPARAERAAPTAAQKKQAVDLKAQGDEAMATLRYADALRAYVGAYEITGDPALLYNQGRACQALGQLSEALEKIEAFNEKASAPLKARVPALAALITELRSKVALVILVSNVSGSRVLIDNKVVGTTPLAGPLKLNAGEVVLQVEADGYLLYRAPKKFPGGATTALDVKLYLKSTTGFLVVTSRTKGARVLVDGKVTGNVPLEIPIQAGVHAVRVEREGFEPVTTSAVVNAGEKKQLEVPLASLRPLTSRWWFWTGIGAAVIAGAVTATALLVEGAATEGSIKPGQLSAPLRIGGRGVPAPKAP